MTQPTRSQWDVGRFLQTISYFETVPIVSWLQKMFLGSTPPPPPPSFAQTSILFDFSQPPEELAQIWGSLDDVVMGGVSTSALQWQAGAALFTGYVSTANSGGFTSVRTRNFDPPLDLSNYQGIELQVMGDGKRYKFFLRDADSWDSMAYAASFDTKTNEWIMVRIPFAQLVPVFRAKRVETARPLDTSQIRSLQLMLSKFEYDGVLNPHFVPGEFQLQVRTIGLY